ncbi:hypothetical protein [Aminobacter sp. HY435]|uniref:hypothetical protein n=1 Tax=Aminobacter sp. HY435 TaxID=2970917 RepID=UPI0022B96305|nr:hypothetical protein [Aminobacter sp. HY435]
MQPSLMGIVVCCCILIVGYRSRNVLVGSLVASLAFGATAIATLTFLGNSSPLIYTFFAALLVTAVAARRQVRRELGDAMGSMRPLWVLGGLMLYAIIGAWLFPRLFAGHASVFVQSTSRRGVVETALGPVSGNVSQTGYFLLGGLTAIALSVLLLRSHGLEQVRRGFILWCSLHAGMGLLDLLGKLSGAGDLLSPIRTASYAMLTNASEGGFARIAGAYSEASAFGGVSLACLAFTFTYWRKTGARYAKWLSATLLLLIILSTSSTAYVGLAILAVPVSISLVQATISSRLGPDDFAIVGVLAAMVVVGLAIHLLDPGFFDPFSRLIESTVINKGTSASGVERTYWNTKSLQAFSDTGGLGVGMGSSRASSWPIAVLSQLGLLGAAMMTVLLIVVARGTGGLSAWIDPESDAIVSSVRACALAGVIAGSLVSGTADPGMVFFIALAVVSVSRVQARRNRVLFGPRQSENLYATLWR